LRSSLRRCEEAYVFSNEGDLALRIASTAANYISFPSRTRYGGYRLGNVTAKHYENQKDRHNKPLEDENYGIVNFHDGKITQQPYSCLEIRASNQEHRKPEEICPLDSTEKEKTDSLRTVPVADLFTYFDCTDYVDIKTDNLDGKDAPGTENSKEINPKGVVSYAIRKSALNLWDYVGLSKAYFFSSGTQHINVHGGFFDGKFSQKVMYQLAFLGFKGFLESLKPDAETSVQLSELSTECRNKQIQVVLSPPLLEKLS
jgi:hypothetical protein